MVGVCLQPSFFCGKWGENMGRTRLFLSMFNCRKPLYFKGFRCAKFQTALGILDQSCSRVYSCSPESKTVFWKQKSPFPIKRKNFKTKWCEIPSEINAKSMRNEAKFVSHISFIGFRKQVAGRACQEKCGESAKKFMEKCKLYLDFSVDLCYDNIIENYERMKNAPT